MRKPNFSRNFGPKETHLINRNIKSPQVLCIDADNMNRGLISINEALLLAESSGLDLVQISSGKDVPTCKILDYSKFKYEIQKKDKAAKKKQRENAVKVKEIKFRPTTGENDLKIKAKQAQAFIDDGDKLKVTITFKGREMSHREVGHEALTKFLAMLTNASIEESPSMYGRNLSATVVKKQDKSAA
jgi:translation initiation factor IF-3